MTAINAYRASAVERLAASIGTALVRWASDREHGAVDRDELKRRHAGLVARAEREHRAQRRLLG